MNSNDKTSKEGGEKSLLSISNQQVVMEPEPDESLDSHTAAASYTMSNFTVNNNSNNTAQNYVLTSNTPQHTTECTVIMEPGSNEGRHILVAIDLSENGWRALTFALEHILRVDDVLTVYYVLDPRDLPASSKGNREEYRKDVSIQTIFFA
jgi:hypothetical protein